MPNVLGVTALELGDPVSVHILSKTDNASFGHASLASEVAASVGFDAGLRLRLRNERRRLLDQSIGVPGALHLGVGRDL